MLGGEGDRGDRDFVEWGGGTLSGDHKFGCSEFCGSGFDTRGCFLLGLPSNPFGACCGFRLRFLRPGYLPGDGNYRVLRSLLDRLRRGIWMWVGGWSGGGLATRPLGRRGSTARPGPSARQRDRSAGLSKRQVGLWRRSIDSVWALALQKPPSLRSTSHRHGRSPCGFPGSHSTESFPAG